MSEQLLISKKVVAYIPARLGSERVRRKNLRLLAGQPLVTYVAETASKAKLLHKLYLNTESPEIAAAVAHLNINIYWRKRELVQAETTTDEILYDFAKSIQCDAIAVINPTAPFVTESTIDKLVEQYLLQPHATWFTTTQLKKHLVLNGAPLNFLIGTRSPRTQDLPPFEYINFIIFCINREKVLQQYEKTGACLYYNPICFLPIAADESHDIDDEFDFQIAGHPQ